MISQLVVKKKNDKQYNQTDNFDVYPEKLVSTDLQLKVVQQKLMEIMKGVEKKKQEIKDIGVKKNDYGKEGRQKGYTSERDEKEKENKKQGVVNKFCQSNFAELKKIQGKEDQKLQLKESRGNNIKNSLQFLNNPPSNILPFLEQWTIQDKIDLLSKKQLERTISFYESKLAQRQNLYIQLKQLRPKAIANTQVHELTNKSNSIHIDQKEGEVNENESVHYEKKEKKNEKNAPELSQSINVYTKNNTSDHEQEEKKIHQQNVVLQNNNINTISKELLNQQIDELLKKIQVLYSENNELKLKNTQLSHQFLQLQQKQLKITELTNKIKQLQQRLQETINKTKQQDVLISTLQQNIQQKQKQLLKFTHRQDKKNGKQNDEIRYDLQLPSSQSIQLLINGVGDLWKKLKDVQNLLQKYKIEEDKNPIPFTNQTIKYKDNIGQSTNKNSPIHLLKEQSQDSNQQEPESQYRLTGYPRMSQAQQQITRPQNMKKSFKKQMIKSLLYHSMQTNIQQLNKQIYQIAEQLINLCKSAMGNCSTQMVKKQSYQAGESKRQVEIERRWEKGLKKDPIIKYKENERKQNFKSLCKIPFKEKPYEQEKVMKNEQQIQEHYQNNVINDPQKLEDQYNDKESLKLINNQLNHVFLTYFNDSKMTSDQQQENSFKQISNQPSQRLEQSQTCSQFSTKFQNEKSIFKNLKKFDDLHLQFDRKQKQTRSKNKQIIERIFDVIKTMILNFKISYQSMDNIIAQKEIENNNKSKYKYLRSYLNQLYKTLEKQCGIENELESPKIEERKYSLYESYQNKLQKLNNQLKVTKLELDCKAKQFEELKNQTRTPSKTIKLQNDTSTSNVGKQSRRQSIDKGRKQSRRQSIDQGVSKNYEKYNLYNYQCSRNINENVQDKDTQLSDNVTELKNQLMIYKKKCSEYLSQIQQTRKGGKKKTQKIIYIRK